MSEEFINYSYIEMLIQDLEENSLGYWNATQDEMAKSLRNLQQENQKLKIEISARETVCDELQERINKVEKGIKHYMSYNTNEGLLEYCMSDLLSLLKGDKE